MSSSAFVCWLGGAVKRLESSDGREVRKTLVAAEGLKAEDRPVCSDS